MTFEEFQKAYSLSVMDKPPFIRKGQFLMNELYQIRPSLYKEITATDNDCFYNDSIVPNTLVWLKENWNK